MDIETTFRSSVLGKIPLEKAAKLVIARARTILVQEGFTSEQIIKFGVDIAVKVLDIMIEALKTCKEKGGERNG